MGQYLPNYTTGDEIIVNLKKTFWRVLRREAGMKRSFRCVPYKHRRFAWMWGIFLKHPKTSKGCSTDIGRYLFWRCNAVCGPEK